MAGDQLWRLHHAPNVALFEFSDNGEGHIKRRSAYACSAGLPAEYDNAMVSSGKYALDDKVRIGGPLVGALGPAAGAVGAGERSLDLRTLGDDHTARGISAR